MTRTLRVLSLAVLFALGLASGTALAQAGSAARTAATDTQASYPEGETALGWTYLHPTDGGPNSELGGALAAAYNLTPWVGLAFDGSVNHFSGQIADTAGWGQTEYALLGGFRFALRQSGMVVPFAHLLAGYGRINIDYAGSSSGDDYFVIQPGGGVDVGSGKFGARVEVSWRRMFYQSGGFNRMRVFAGLVVRSGPKHPAF